MKPSTPALALLLLTGAVLPAHAHLIGEDAHDGAAPHYDFSVVPPGAVRLRGTQLRGDVVLMAQAQRPFQPVVTKALPAKATPFLAFAPKVKVRADGQFLYVESDGLPAHNMMVGITAWQQQVPLPQPYTGNNAWRIPLNPVPAKTPVSIKGRFLRGAVALAVNGIPIFNPQNNRGEISQEIGELDQWGGHCGRADDYHYHATPFHLQATAGKGQPLAYALDGYPIHGLTEPDGSAPGQLDALNGHQTTALGYHYHGSTKYPYVNGGFHGEVVERDGQVDPQPRAQPMRGAGAPLRGARITAFTAKDNQSFSLRYEVGGEARLINYALNANGTAKFDYVDARGQVKSETYSPRAGGGDGPPGEPKGKAGKQKGPGGAKDDRPPPPPGPPPDRPDARGPGGPGGSAYVPNPAASYTPARSGKFVLRSPVVAEGGALPVEFTGDGSGVSPPLEWTGAPPGTRSFAVIMHHIPGPGDMKWYWTLYNIPANVAGLPKHTQGIGTLGNSSVNHRPGYAPPHSKGPGAKTYILTVYVLSAPVQLSAPPAEVDRDTLLVAMKDLILDSAELKVVYDRTGRAGGAGGQQQAEPKR